MSFLDSYRESSYEVEFDHFMRSQEGLLTNKPVSTLPGLSSQQVSQLVVNDIDDRRLISSRFKSDNAFFVIPNLAQFGHWSLSFFAFTKMCTLEMNYFVVRVHTDTLVYQIEGGCAHF